MRRAPSKWSAIGKSLWQCCEGSALVEGAIVVPVLFALVFGVYEFSWFFYQQHVISTGLRDAARYLARSADPCDPSSSFWIAAEENSKNLATTGLISGGAERIRGWTPAMVIARCNPVDNSPHARGLRAHRGGAVIHVVTLSTRFNDPSLGFFRVLGLPSPIIAVAHSERVIGPG